MTTKPSDVPAQFVDLDFIRSAFEHYNRRPGLAAAQVHDALPRFREQERLLRTRGAKMIDRGRLPTDGPTP